MYGCVSLLPGHLLRGRDSHVVTYCRLEGKEKQSMPSKAPTNNNTHGYLSAEILIKMIVGSDYLENI